MPNFDVKDFACPDDQIRELESRIGKLQERMEALRGRFVVSAIATAVEWCAKYTEQTVTQMPDVAKQVGKEGVANLKADLRVLTESMPAIIEKRLSETSLWSHKGELPSYERGSDLMKYHLPSSHRPPEVLDKAIRDIASKLVPVLSRNGFAEPLDPGQSARGSGLRNLVLVGSLEWSRDMRAVIGQYDGLHCELCKLADQLRSAQRAKAEAEAKDLWDSA